MTKPGNRGIRRLVAATDYSLRGFKSAWVSEEAFRTEVYLGVVLIPSAFLLGETTVERILLVMSCIFVIFAELANTAIESIVDRIGSEHNVLSGQAKDLGSAMVFVANLSVVFVWSMIGWARLSI